MGIAQHNFIELIIQKKMMHDYFLQAYLLQLKKQKMSVEKH